MASGHKAIKVTATGDSRQNGIYLKGKTTIAGEGTLAASGKNGIYHTNDTLTIGGNVTVEAEGTETGLAGYMYKQPRTSITRYYSTLQVKDGATVKAKGQSKGAISNWKELILNDGHKITSPEGAHWTSHAVFGEDGLTSSDGRSVTAVAESDSTRVEVIYKEDLDDFVSTSPAKVNLILRCLSYRLRRLNIDFLKNCKEITETYNK